MSNTKRRKPWYRPRNVFLALLATVVLFFGWAFLEVCQVYTAEPSPTVDYRAKLREMALEHAGVPTDGASRTWALLQTATDVTDRLWSELDAELVVSNFEQRYDWDAGEVDFAYVLHGKELPQQVDRERQCLDRMRDKGVMDTLARFAKQPPGFRTLPNDETLLVMTLPSLSRVMNLASARVASMRLAFTDGNVEEITIAFEQMLAIGATISAQPTLTDFRVGAAIQSKALTELRRELMEAEFNEPACRRMLEAIDHFQLPAVSYCMESERLAFHELIQMSFTDDGNGNGYLIPGSRSWEWTFNDEHLFRSALAARFYYADREEVRQRYDAWVDGYLREGSMLPIERWRSDFDPEEIEKELSARHRFLSHALPAFGKMMLRDNLYRIQRAGTRIMLAVEIYRAANGRYPNGLDELTTSILPDLPNDPFHHGPFGYRLVEDDPHDRPYLLYSTGSDRSDGGGKEPSGIDADYWGPEGVFTTSKFPNHDYIINTPRSEEW